MPADSVLTPSQAFEELTVERRALLLDVRFQHSIVLEEKTSKVQSTDERQYLLPIQRLAHRRIVCFLFFRTFGRLFGVRGTFDLGISHREYHACKCSRTPPPESLRQRLRLRSYRREHFAGFILDTAPGDTFDRVACRPPRGQLNLYTSQPIYCASHDKRSQSSTVRF